MRCQGYDGVPNMSSQRVGVQARIREKSPFATYIHCSGHCLNLVIAHSCALPEVRNVLDKLKKLYMFFQKSANGNGLLCQQVSGRRNKTEGIARSLSDTLALRHKAYQHFYQEYTYLLETLR